MNLIELSRLLQKSPATISAGIRQGVFPFAVSAPVRGEKHKMLFLPGKLQEYVNTKSQYDLSINAVAKMLGITPLTLQVFLQRGLLPIGTAYKTRPENEKYVYVIYPGKLEEYIVGRQQVA